MSFSSAFLLLCYFSKSAIRGLHNLLCDVIRELLEWMVIDNPKSKLNFGFALSIEFVILIHFGLLIWVVNHIILIDLDWIDNPKTLIEQ